MRAIMETGERGTAQAAAVLEASARKLRAADELYEFRRYNYADGWDSDDADLGWVDESIVSTRKRRLH